MSDNKQQNLLGMILEQEHMLNRDQIRAILTEQRRLREAGQVKAFGEIAIQQKVMSPEQLRFALQLQRKLAYAPGPRKRLGYLLIEAGVAKPSVVVEALVEQEKTGQKLGEIMVERGLLSAQVLQVFLKLQAAGITDMKKTIAADAPRPNTP